MNRMILLAAIAAIPLAGCTTDQQGMPLVFARAQDVGVSVGATVADQGAHLTLGFSDRNVAIVPTVTPQGNLIRSVATENNQPFNDALSVLGQFEVTAKGGTEVSAGLGTFFSTGLAARNLAEGFRDKMRGFGQGSDAGTVFPLPGPTPAATPAPNP
ncbi:MAG: hypothetical protein H7Y62_04200 [Hyphomicrobium sp.]|nr:hypothetical protein [Hyphomicrobium sp.]